MKNKTTLLFIGFKNKAPNPVPKIESLKFKLANKETYSLNLLFPKSILIFY